MKCTRGLVGWATRLYPRWWRKRYGAELDALLDDVDLRWRDVASIVRGGMAMRLTRPELAMYEAPKGGRAARAVPVVLLVVATLQVGAMLAVVGTVARGEGPPACRSPKDESASWDSVGAERQASPTRWISPSWMRWSSSTAPLPGTSPTTNGLPRPCSACTGATCGQQRRHPGLPRRWRLPAGPTRRSSTRGATVFLKAQEGLAANRRATEDAWPRTLAFLREQLGN